MKSYRPPKKALRLWQIRSLAVTLVFIAVTSWLWFLTMYSTFITIAAVIAYIAVSFFYLPCYFRKYEILLDENALIIKSGVFITHERIMPYPRMLYTERLRTPLSYKLGLSALLIRATRATAVILELHNDDVDGILEATSK